MTYLKLEKQEKVKVNRVSISAPAASLLPTDQCAEGGLLPAPINLGVSMDFCVFRTPIKVSLEAGGPAGAAGMQEYPLPPFFLGGRSHTPLGSR